MSRWTQRAPLVAPPSWSARGEPPPSDDSPTRRRPAAALTAAQVVVLGAGLDGRAWRLPSLAGADAYEVDHPASQDAKRDRVAAAGLALASKTVTYVPVDFSRDRLDDRLAAAGHRRGEPTIWIREGVVPYLRGDEVAATVAALASLSARRGAT